METGNISKDYKKFIKELHYLSYELGLLMVLTFFRHEKKADFEAIMKMHPKDFIKKYEKYFNPSEDDQVYPELLVSWNSKRGIFDYMSLLVILKELREQKIQWLILLENRKKINN